MDPKILKCSTSVSSLISRANALCSKSLQSLIWDTHCQLLFAHSSAFPEVITDQADGYKQFYQSSNRNEWNIVVTARFYATIIARQGAA
jgi:hypothetical protein